ncbi:MAG: homoserine O-acetyltransferase [Calditrichaeota bacterium]|nr:homoserine O-acetyltransferase [Calditrichota bacterium]
MLEMGGQLKRITVAFEAYGNLNAEKTNVILVCHALTGSSHAADLENRAPELFAEAFEKHAAPLEPSRLGTIQHYPGWWNALIGPGKALDTEKYCILVPNLLGSCYGTTGPLSRDPISGSPYRTRFPSITVRDMVRVQQLLMKTLGIRQLNAVVGGSLGGMQVLEWALMFPQQVQAIIPIATSARHSPWAIAFNEVSRRAILNDPAWQEGNYTHPPVNGMKLARMIAMISYRSFSSFLQKFSRQMMELPLPSHGFSDNPFFQVERYLHYQGDKFFLRFDANSYLYLTRAMDWHDITRGRGSLPDVLEKVTVPALFIGIQSDVLYPVEEQKEMARHVPMAEYREIQSPHGHDAFLIEFDQLAAILKPFLERISPSKRVLEKTPQTECL